MCADSRDLVARTRLPPGDVVRHQPVAVAHGRPELVRVVEVERVPAGRLREGHARAAPSRRGRPLSCPRGPAAGRAGTAPSPRGRPSRGARPGGRARYAFVYVPAGAAGRSPRYSAVRRGVQVGQVPGGVPEHRVVQLRPRVREVVAHEPHRVVRVPDVVRAHPLDEGEVLPRVPPRVRVLELLPHDAPRVAAAGPHVRVQPQAAAPARLQREGAKAFVLHQVAQDAVLQPEELVRAVRRLAQPQHLRVAHHASEGPQVVQVAVRVGGAQRVGVALRRPQGALPGDGSVPALRSPRRAAAGTGSLRSGFASYDKVPVPCVSGHHRQPPTFLGGLSRPRACR